MPIYAFKYSFICLHIPFNPSLILVYCLFFKSLVFLLHYVVSSKIAILLFVSIGLSVYLPVFHGFGDNYHREKRHVSPGATYLARDDGGDVM